MRCLLPQPAPTPGESDGSGSSGANSGQNDGQRAAWADSGWSAEGSGSPWYEAAGGPLPLQHPVVLRGAAAAWPAARHWSPDALCARPGFGGLVRVAPSLQFPFVEPALAELLFQARGEGHVYPSYLVSCPKGDCAAQKQRTRGLHAQSTPQLRLSLQSLPPAHAGRSASPSVQVSMSGPEFLRRMRAASGAAASSSSQSQGGAGGREPPIVYSPREYYYMQAEVPADLAAEDLGWAQLLEEIATAAGGGGGGAGEEEAGGGAAGGALGLPRVLRLAQAPRAWAGPAGAVSPLHYDASHSFLVQLHGRKRMLFLDPDQLPAAYSYPDTHLLRRRARVNPAAPDYRR